jgi:hypothetical protein
MEDRAMRLRTAAALLLAAALAGCDAIDNLLHPPPDIKFAPSGEAYAAKPDFARVEHDYPLSVAELQKLTPANIVNYSQ